jgi:hypothetical protein
MGCNTYFFMKRAVFSESSQKSCDWGRRDTETQRATPRHPITSSPRQIFLLEKSSDLHNNPGEKQ